MSLVSKVSHTIAKRLGDGIAALRLRDRKSQIEHWAKARKHLWTDVGIWYHADYAAPGLAQSAKLPHVELGRGGKIVDSLELEGLIWGRDVRRAAPIPLSALLRAHSMEYLESVTEAGELARIFGLQASDVDVDTVLKSQRRAAGGTLAASRWASRGRGRLAFNLGGGFHHAEPERGAGFCVYNDVAASILTLRESGYHGRCAVVDLDFHQGNGNRVAFANDASVLTYSIHGAVWSHVEAIASVAITLPSGTGDAQYLAELRRTLEPALRAHRPQLIFYIAGTDILASDALGDFCVSEEGALARDRHVLGLAAELGASTVVTLAGGYSPSAWRSAGRMVRWALTGSTDPLPTRSDGEIRRLFGKIASGLDPYQLQFEEADDFQITEADLMGELEGTPKANRILDYYSVHGVELAFEKYGFLEKLRHRGFTDLRFQVDPSDPERQRVSIYGSLNDTDYHRLVEMLVCRRRVPLPGLVEDDGAGLDMLSIEWLLMQDPTREFSESRARLPGQEHPGLGMLHELLEMLYQACLRLGLDGIILHPSRFHIAAVGEGQGFFLAPEVEGRFRALAETLGVRDLSAVSSLIDREMVMRNDGTVFEWVPEDFVAPVSTRLRDYLSASGYQGAVEAARSQAIADGIVLRDFGLGDTD